MGTTTPLHIRRDRLLAEVAKKHGLTVAQITGNRRTRPVCRARHEWFYRARAELGMTLPRIGQVTGGRDHATVIYGIKRHAAAMCADEQAGA